MSTRKVKVIVNADDLGLSKVVNFEIDKLLGVWVSSSTILANSPFYYDAIQVAKRHPECGFGVHLNVTEFKPLTAAFLNDSKFVSEGEFNGLFRVVKLSFIDYKNIYYEFCAQVQRVLNSGLQISHIDSHHHVHTQLRLLIILKLVSLKFGINRVRISRNLCSDTYRPRATLKILKKMYNLLLSVVGFQVVNYFCDIQDIDSLNELKTGVVEVMCHPGSESNPFLDEYKIKLQHLFDDGSYSLISYHKT